MIDSERSPAAPRFSVRVRRDGNGGRTGAGRHVVRGWKVSGAVALMVLCASSASPQAPPADAVANRPVFRLVVTGSLDPEFTRRISNYHELRRGLEARLPPQVTTDSAAEMRRAELALAHLVRVARAGAHEGDIFTAASVKQFREALTLVMTPRIWAAIMDDNPGGFSHRINGDYPKTKTLSTMPYNILSQLPELPDGIEYRFLRRTLILHDTHANVILDRLRYAIRCDGCDS